MLWSIKSKYTYFQKWIFPKINIAKLVDDYIGDSCHQWKVINEITRGLRNKIVDKVILGVPA